MKAVRNLFLAATLAAAAPASAGLFRAYLSVTGSDANPCTVTAPCRLLPAALAAVDPDGEIWMLDSANYNAGPVVVDKSVTILAVPGALGSFVASGGPALTVAAPATNVSLRNINVRPLSGSEGQVGIQVQGTGLVFGMEGCDVAAFNASGGIGVRITNAAIAHVARTRLTGNDVGLDVASGATAWLSDSRISRGSTGVLVHATRGGQLTTATVERSTITRAQVGVNVEIDAGNFSTARALVVDSFIGLGTTAVQSVGTVGTGSLAIVEVVRTTIYGQGLIGFYVSGSGGNVVAADNVLVNNPLFMYELFQGGTIESTANNRYYFGSPSAPPTTFPRF